MLQLFNTLHRKKEPFEPRDKGKVSLYTCGPTVYAPAQIGNLRSYVFGDILKRWLRYGHGYDVRHVMNITDVEDKIIRDSGATTVAAMRKFTKPFTERFFADLSSLGAEPATKLTVATEYVPQMIAFVAKLIELGFAYERDSSVYFDIRAYNESAVGKYGQLLNLDPEGFGAVSRIDQDEYDKDNVQDFALWKAERSDKPGWHSPWGHGRPGWHIECSVMARAELGDTIDIHTGGVDLIFPHHENEIAQSTALTGQPLANYWLHSEHLLVDGAKMAKSKNNFYTLDDVRDKGFDPGVLRLMFVSAHYRSKLNFTWPSLTAAKASYERIQQLLLRLNEPVASADPNPVYFETEVVKRDFAAAMDDDLNTPAALAVIFDLITNINDALDNDELSEAKRGEALTFFAYVKTVLGVFELVTRATPPEIQGLLGERQKARDTRDFARSDEIRDQIKAHGWDVEDIPGGQRVKKT